jgi:hypothetical protein
LVRLIVQLDELLSYPDGLKVLGIAVINIAVVTPLWLVWQFFKAKTFKRWLQLNHPGPWSWTRFGQGRNSEDSLEGAVDFKDEGDGIHPGPRCRRQGTAVGPATKTTCLFRFGSVGARHFSKNGNTEEAVESSPTVGY